MTPQRKRLFNGIVTIAMLVNLFKVRVLADGGAIEGEANLLNQNLGNINAASFVLIPSGYKAGKVHAVKPIDGSSDMSITGASGAGRYNNIGIYENLATNVPQLDYSKDINPGLLIEPVATNYFWPSNDITGFTTNNLVISGNVITENTSNGSHNLATLFRAITSNSSNCYSVYVKRQSANLNRSIILNVSNGVDGEVTSKLLKISDFTLSGTENITGPSWTAVSTGVVILPNNDCIFYVAGIPTVGLSSRIQIGIYANGLSNYTGDGTSSVFISGIQMEKGIYPTSRILTTTAAATRLGRIGTSTINLATNVGTWFIELPPQSNFQGANNPIWKFGDFEIRANNATSWFWYYDNASLGGFTFPKNVNNKIVTVFNGSNVKLYINGVFIITYTNRATAIKPSSLTISGNGGISVWTNKSMVFDRELSLAEIQNL